MSLTKYIQIDSHLPDGTPAIEPLHSSRLIKTASVTNSLIKQAADTLPQREDGIWVLLNALGAGEYWGSNSNGDYFPEESLKYACDLSYDCPKVYDYGFKTFEKYAFPYRHHVNKDPRKSVGERVKLAVWNDNMKRVELIHFLRRSSEFDDFGDIIKVGAPDLVEQIENGEICSVSMGCKVPFDVCSVCGNQAKNIASYCDHLKYAMNQVLDNGIKVAAHNTRPRFFDISYVEKGAEKTAKVLKKLAACKEEAQRLGNRTVIWVAEGITRAESNQQDYSLPSAFYAELVKSAQRKKEAQEEPKKAEEKAGTISKVVPSNVGAESANGLAAINKEVGAPLLKAIEPDMPEAVMKVLSRNPLGDVCSTMTAMGMALKPHEMRRIVIMKIKGGKSPDQIGTPEISVNRVRPSLARLLHSQLEKRSSLREPMRRRVLDLLAMSPDQIMDKIAANDEAANQEALMLQESSLLEKAIPLTALAAALFALYRKGVKGAKVPKFIESAFANHPELPAAVVGAGIGGAFGPLGRMMVRSLGQEKTAGRAREAALVGGALLAPYLYSGHIQAKALRGERVTRGEVAAARSPGKIGLTAAGLVAYRKRLGSKAKQLAKGLFKKAESNSGLDNLFEKRSSAPVPIEDFLRYGSDPELVDLAIAEGLRKVSARLETLVS